MPDKSPQMLKVIGLDQFGRRTLLSLPALPPSLYFWLGSEAYPPFEMINRIEGYPLHAV